MKFKDIIPCWIRVLWSLFAIVNISFFSVVHIPLLYNFKSIVDFDFFKINLNSQKCIYNCMVRMCCLSGPIYASYDSCRDRQWKPSNRRVGNRVSWFLDFCFYMVRISSLFYLSCQKFWQVSFGAVDIFKPSLNLHIPY